MIVIVVDSTNPSCGDRSGSGGNGGGGGGDGGYP